MYRQGFDDVYHRVAQIPDNVPMNMRRVITKAIHRSSKPDLAIEVAMEAGRRGVDAVPTLLKKCSRGYCGWPAVAPINLFAVGARRRKALRQLNKTSLARKMDVLLPTGFDRITAWSGRETAGIGI